MELPGTICHLILELLCLPKRKEYYDQVVSNQDIFCIPSIKKLVYIWANRLDVADPDNIELINEMTVNGLQYDYFGQANGKASHAFSEKKKFDIVVDEDDKRYHINGFIDKLFLYKEKRLPLYETLKQVKKYLKVKMLKIIYKI